MHISNTTGTEGSESKEFGTRRARFMVRDKSPMAALETAGAMPSSPGPSNPHVAPGRIWTSVMRACDRVREPAGWQQKVRMRRGAARRCWGQAVGLGWARWAGRLGQLCSLRPGLAGGLARRGVVGLPHYVDLRVLPQSALLRCGDQSLRLAFPLIHPSIC